MGDSDASDAEKCVHDGTLLDLQLVTEEREGLVVALQRALPDTSASARRTVREALGFLAC